MDDVPQLATHSLTVHSVLSVLLGPKIKKLFGSRSLSLLPIPFRTFSRNTASNREFSALHSFNTYTQQTMTKLKLDNFKRLDIVCTFVVPYSLIG